MLRTGALECPSNASAMTTSLDSCPMGDIVVIFSTIDGAVGVEEELEDRGCTILRADIEGHRGLHRFRARVPLLRDSADGAFPTEDMFREAVVGISDSASIIGASAESLVEALDGNVEACYSTSNVHACSVGFKEAMPPRVYCPLWTNSRSSITTSWSVNSIPTCMSPS